ncbi:MAG: heme exporter protein CcmD [Pseudomonadales bacterium]|nr:heme exporter protein CcmD [Pseudomonadales bacterium]MCP5213940.1 heme exporter protein CcmD [Pseudomonadales bacterium]MCP5302850.1 heme exporter protein CcmD [Pseudomonadales bacterium]
MSFSSFSDFIHMGGHGLYVWISYATALAVLVFNILMPMRLRKQFMVEQARQQRREEQNASHS